MAKQSECHTPELDWTCGEAGATRPEIARGVRGDVQQTCDRTYSDVTEPGGFSTAGLSESSVERLLDSLAPGTRIGSYYSISRLLGVGGMGIVFQAQDELLMRDVAIKFISPRLLGNADSITGFLQEARAMARVSHPNVVEVFTFGEHEDKPYFVMEYVPGLTGDTWLRERMLRAGAPPPVDEVLGIIDQCCRGVEAIHASGALHGDLKPGNVLLGPAFRVALTDLGLALLLDHGERTQVAGTPAYMAPETFESTSDAALLRRRDVYALAVMTYQFLTGRLPQPVQRGRAADGKLLFGPPAAPSQVRSDLPHAFDEVLLMALAADPQERTASAEAFRKQLIQARRSATERKFAARLLVIDDDPNFLALVDRSLRAALPGATVICVPDGATALEELERRPVDLAIVGLELPDMNGVELTATIRAIDSAGRTPILVVTAEGSARDWRLLFSLGANSFLVKPIDPGDLTAVVGRMLERPATGRI